MVNKQPQQEEEARKSSQAKTSERKLRDETANSISKLIIRHSRGARIV
jgi:hypothetical protein